MPRSAEVSAGLLVYRRKPALQVLLAHPGGPFWAKKDEGAWSIPKGLVEPGNELLATARREFAEETGLSVSGKFIPLEPVRQKSGKTVHAFAVEADPDIGKFRSNEFELEWPPKSGRMQRFPEVDRVAWFGLDAAAKKMHAYQRPLLESLKKKLEHG
ncbi:MAG: NUDIX domain-containing protein [Bradyrhizobiaceae bacterium]|nr:NUDIX domain-containing protein [Bradyrhizobiaceae bacterium]